MAIGSSVVGVWRPFVDWGDTGFAGIASPITFLSGGDWTYYYGGGRWIQMEGMLYFNFTNGAGLGYSANVTRDTLCGIMGYAAAGTNPGSGVWWATRPGAPGLAPPPEPPMDRKAKKAAHDYMLGPAKK